MSEPYYTLKVRTAQEERQLRRLGAAVSLEWDRLPESTRAHLLAEASRVRISGETATAEEIRAGLEEFLSSRRVSKP